MSVIKIKNLVKRYKKIRAVKGVSFAVQRGEIFGYLGENGAGKTTTISCMMDFLRPTSGSITILGLDAQKESVRLKKSIGYLSDTISLYNDWTGQAHIDFFAKLGQDESDHSRDKTNHDCQNLIKRLNFDPSIKAGRLSTGNRQKLGLILALMHRPKLLVLDEPTNGLDPVMQNIFYQIIKERAAAGTTVFMSSHNLPEIEKIASRVAIIKAGNLVALENVDVLKQKRLYRITVTTAQNITSQDINKGQLKLEQKTQDGYILSARGDINLALKVLSDYQISNLEIRRASLENIFMEYYE